MKPIFLKLLFAFVRSSTLSDDQLLINCLLVELIAMYHQGCKLYLSARLLYNHSKLIFERFHPSVARLSHTEPQSFQHKNAKSVTLRVTT